MQLPFGGLVSGARYAMFRLLDKLFRPKHPAMKICWGAWPERRPWWKRYRGAASGRPQPPGPKNVPDMRLAPGTHVRLKGKPDRVRRVIKAVWHHYRRQFVYIVETSARRPFEPYWFADQLTPEGRTPNG